MAPWQLLLLALLAIIVALAFIAGWFEDLESEIGSQSNPNSQVQLAPQMGVVHRFFNKAISGEPALYAFLGGTAGGLFVVFWQGFHLHPLIALPLATGLTEVFHVTCAFNAHTSRIASASTYGHPLYMDVLLVHLPLIAAHGFMAVTAITALSYIFYTSIVMPLVPEIKGFIGYPVVIPALSLMLGITAGAIGSSTGDLHYGAEREFQHVPFGEGVPMKHYGYITVYAELGVRNSMDIVWFCAKLGGVMTGFTYGLILLLDNFRLLTGNLFANVAINIVIGALVLAILFFLNRYIEVWSRKKFGPYS
ncbi:MAG: tetrahydromethanopterin S-methyltransferase subunit E [Candidatus Methanomethylicota archaeon]|uniref:Tetrahydromethanopterin S-methyltransferase subunit E n=1 Tax=Thermoproteota archaeon TaxID=2056631 RepID=A0A497EPZ0_9CREN|nr:MAG: tetrahydromethanopterin S-methyltransferase subunit E [Candidatus Verstraetearchaeota archaeon]RLE53259.1 MAG: tetrahydromethanopterin S-methyltransferase subunit E [Candidatus Verstraetearchaeota archaeon]